VTTQTFLLPDLGEGLTEAEIVRWLVAVGDVVAVDAPVAEVETAKSIVEVPSPYAGVVAELHGVEGGTVDVGKPLITIGTAVPAAPAPAPAAPASATTASATTASAAPAPAAPAPAAPALAALALAESAPAGAEPARTAGEAYREEEKAGSGNVLIGYGTPGARGSGRRRKPRGLNGAVETVVVEPVRPAVPLVISPLVRRMARDAKVDLHALSGSGAGGVITRRDVEAAIARGDVEVAITEAGPARPGRPTEPEPASRSAGAPLVAVGDVDSRVGLAELRRVPMSGFRKAVAATLSRSRAEIPEATTWVDVDATELMALRDSLRTATDPGPGLLALMARFVVAGLQKYPELNGFVDTEREELVQYDGINLGLAAQTERGLVVPAVARAHAMTARGLDAEIRRLTASARDGRLTAHELSCGTFTLNNYGSFGVDGSAAIINHPQVAILGVGRIIDRPWVVNGEIAVRKLTQLSLVFDHRVCDGGLAAAFLRFVADAFEHPTTAFADL
jgi:pyruvate dehydrogenase E2 component (dihydrolipoamide acetyltransferase)